MTTRFSAELLADLPALGKAEISPDGALIAVPVGPASNREKHPVTALWLACVDGDRPARQLTAGSANDRSPRWSPDGSQLAFLSDRKERGTAQIYVLSLEGGEGQPLTDTPGGVSDFCWLPGDIPRIAYLAKDARDRDEDERRSKEGDDARVYGAFWPYARVVVLNIRSRDERANDTGQKHVASLAPSPDGTSLAITLWDTPEIDNIMATSQLAVLHLDDGNVIKLGPRGFNADGVTWSRDGQRLFFFGVGGATPVSSYQLWTSGVDGKDSPSMLSTDMPACIYDVAGGTRVDDVLTLVAEGTESAIYRFRLDGGTPERIAHFPGDLSGLSVSADGRTVAVLGSTADRPFNIYAGDPESTLARVTDFHELLDDVPLGDQEVITWKRGDITLDGLLIWPHGKSRADGPLPAIVSLHGGPYGRWANGFIGRYFGRWLAAHGYLVFLPNPRGGMGHGQAFAEAVLHTVGDEDYLDVMAGIDTIVEQGFADADRLGCGGWSQGGFMTAWIVGHTQRFKAAVMGAGVSDWGMMIATSDIPTYEHLMGGGNPFTSAGPHSFDKQSPISYVSNATTPTMIVHGENDERVPVSQGIFFHRGLRAHGVPTQLVTYPREPHGIQERTHQIDLLGRIADWYRQWIPVEQD